MADTQRQSPILSACGLNCGLCPRYHTDGASRCPGCGGKGFSEKRPSCGVISCNGRHGIEFCYLCDEYPCKKFDGSTKFDSFITHRHMQKDFEKAKSIGLDAYLAELQEKMAVLQELLEHYNDGRKKSFFCLAVNLLERDDITGVMERLRAEGESLPEKEKAALATALFQEVAERRNEPLTLNKKGSPG